MNNVIDLPKPKVIIHFDEDGCDSAVTDIPCDVICVDERSPGDRVYRMKHQPYGRQLVKALLGASPVGHADDDALSEDEKRAIVEAFDINPDLPPDIA